MVPKIETYAIVHNSRADRCFLHGRTHHQSLYAFPHFAGRFVSHAVQHDSTDRLHNNNQGNFNNYSHS